jgi:hypothetical protein
MRYDTQTVNDRAARSPRAPRTALDRVYDRVIRDLCTRAVPGLLVLLALAVSVTSFAEVGLALERATVWMWVIAFGGGWLIGFALLEIGRRFNLALLTPEAITDDQYWTTEERFRATSSRRHHAEYDRLVTIRDGLAAASVALFVSLITLGVDFVVDVHLHESPWSEIRNGATALAVLIVIAVGLQLAHRVYVRRAWRYLSFAGDDVRSGRGPGSPPTA